MLHRVCGTALLCALITLLAGCDGDQLDRGTVPNPVEGENGDEPAWLQEAKANQLSAEKTKDKFKPNAPVLPPEKLRPDTGPYDRLERPLPTQPASLRVHVLPHQPPETPWRGTPLKKGAAAASETARDDQANASVVDLSTLQPAAAAQPGADVVDLNSMSANPAANTTANTASNGATSDAGARTNARQIVAASGRATADADALPAAETVDVQRLPLSRIEALYNASQGLAHGRRLEQYGYKSFANGPRPEALVPPDPDYVLGPNDEIHVKSVDAFEFDRTLLVERDGTIFIDKDNIGPIKVAGLKFKDLLETIRAAIIAQKGKDKPLRVDVSLGKLHAIRVRIDGYVKVPGLQALTANATLMDALLAAGGPTKDGTLRDVIVQRPGQVDTHIDLYVMLGTGNAIADVVLLSGDRVFVGPIGPTAAVIAPSGSGIFELLEKTTLVDLMKFTGRMNPFTQLNNVEIEHTVNNRRREIEEIDYAHQAATLIVQDGDVIKFNIINTIPNDTVAIGGAVMRPGTYPFKEGMTVSDLIRRAQGFLVDANRDRAVIRRPLGTPAAFDVTPGDRAGKMFEETIVIDLAGILAENKEADIPLRRLDTLTIYTNLQERDDPTVRITGGVRRPGVYKLTAGLTLGDLIRLAGGPTKDAFQGESKIVRLKHSANDMQMNVENYKFRLEDVLHRLADYNLLLENQDQIVIKQVQSMQVTVRIGGRVQFPSTYILPDGSKLSNLLAEAGGLLPDADLRAAVFTRKRIQTLELARLDDLFTRMEEVFGDKSNDVIRDGRNNEGIAAHLAFLGLAGHTSNIERFQARGRIVVNLTCESFLASNHNVVLEDGDELYIPRRENVIMVLGECNYPNAYIWNNGMTVGDYINKAGGPLPEADKKQIYVVMASGEVYSDANKSLFGGSVSGFRPGPGDTILIPKHAPKRGALSTASDVTLLIRQMAETGLIGASIPQALSRNAPAVQLGINPSNQTPPDIITNQAPEQFYNDQRNQNQNSQNNLNNQNTQNTQTVPNNPAR